MKRVTGNGNVPVLIINLRAPVSFRNGVTIIKRTVMSNDDKMLWGMGIFLGLYTIGVLGYIIYTLIYNPSGI